MEAMTTEPFPLIDLLGLIGQWEREILDTVSRRSSNEVKTCMQAKHYIFVVWRGSRLFS